MKVYLMIDNEDAIIDSNNLIAVGKKQDADKLVENDVFVSYEIIEVMNTDSVENFYLNNIGRG